MNPSAARRSSPSAARLFQEALDVDEMMRSLLASEGFSAIDEVAYVDASEIAEIDGFDEATAQELQTRAIEYLERRNIGTGRAPPRIRGH